MDKKGAPAPIHAAHESHRNLLAKLDETMALLEQHMETLDHLECAAIKYLESEPAQRENKTQPPYDPAQSQKPSHLPERSISANDHE